MIDLNKMTIMEFKAEVRAERCAHHNNIIPCCANNWVKCPQHHDVDSIIEILSIMKVYSASHLIVHCRRNSFMELWKGNVLLARLGRSQIKHMFIDDKNGVQKIPNIPPHLYQNAFTEIVNGLNSLKLYFNFNDENFLNKNNIFKAA